MATAFRCPSRTSHYLAIGRSKAIKVDLFLAAGPPPQDGVAVRHTAPLASSSAHTSPSGAGSCGGGIGGVVGADEGSQTPWFTDDDWNDVLGVLKDFLHEQVSAQGRRPLAQW